MESVKFLGVTGWEIVIRISLTRGLVKNPHGRVRTCSLPVLGWHKGCVKKGVESEPHAVDDTHVIILRQDKVFLFKGRPRTWESQTDPTFWSAMWFFPS